MLNIDQVIIKPVVTEKSNEMREAHKYVFRVDARANKIQIIKDVKNLYDVHPTKCNIINISRKPRRVRYKKGYTATWKKAIVTLPENETINAFEGV